MTPDQKATLDAVASLIKEQRSNGKHLHVESFVTPPPQITNEVKTPEIHLDLSDIANCLERIIAVQNQQNGAFLAALEKITNALCSVVTQLGRVADRPITPSFSVQASPPPSVTVGQPNVTVQGTDIKMLERLVAVLEGLSKPKRLVIDHGDGLISRVNEE